MAAAMALAFARVMLAMPPDRHLVSDSPLTTSALFTDPKPDLPTSMIANYTGSIAINAGHNLVSAPRADSSEEQSIRLQEEKMTLLETQMSDIEKDAGQVVDSTPP